MGSQRVCDDDEPPTRRWSPFRDFGLTVGTGLAILGMGVGVKAEDPELMRLLVTQAPGVFAALLITIFFLRHLRAVNQDEERVVERIMETVEDTHDRCHEVHDRSIQAINRNTLALGQLLESERKRKRKKTLAIREKSATVAERYVPPKEGPPNPDKTGE